MKDSEDDTTVYSHHASYHSQYQSRHQIPPAEESKSFVLRLDKCSPDNRDWTEDQECRHRIKHRAAQRMRSGVAYDHNYRDKRGEENSPPSRHRQHCQSCSSCQNREHLYTLLENVGQRTVDIIGIDNIVFFVFSITIFSIIITMHHIARTLREDCEEQTSQCGERLKIAMRDGGCRSGNDRCNAEP